MTANERRIAILAEQQDEYAQQRRTEIVEDALARAARVVERNADHIMNLAESVDPRVKRAIYDVAKQIRGLGTAA